MDENNIAPLNFLFVLLLISMLFYAHLNIQNHKETQAKIDTLLKEVEKLESKINP